MRYRPAFILLALISVASIGSCGKSGSSSSSDGDANDVDATYVKQHGLFLMHEFAPTTGRSSISVTHSDGPGTRLLTSDGGSPSWTPDGRVIFISGRSGSQQIWIMDDDGGNAVQISHLAEDMMPIMPQLAENGLIVYNALQRGTDESLRQAVDYLGRHFEKTTDEERTAPETDPAP